MKNIKVVFLAVISLLLGYACEDDKDYKTIDAAKVVPAAILTPSTGSSYELLLANDTAVVETFIWSAAEFGQEVPVKYSLQLDRAGNNFADTLELNNLVELNYTIKVAELNLSLWDYGVTTGSAENFDLRVVSALNKPIVDNTYNSEIVNITIKPFIYPKPNLLTPSESNYVLEIDSLNKIPFEKFSWNTVNYGASYASTYTVEFDTVGNEFADAVQLYSGTKTEYTPTMFELNNLMIGRGFEAGLAANVEFRVKANTSGKGNIESDTKTYNIKTYTAELIVPPLYLVGDATSAGWNNASGLEIKWDKANNEYSLITTFKAGGMKILEVSGQWAPQWGDDGTNSGKLKYRPDEATTDPPQIPSPGAGSFKMKVDIENLTYSFEAQ